MDHMAGLAGNDVLRALLPVAATIICSSSSDRGRTTLHRADRNRLI
jgi:hypothetical protein